MKDTKIEWCDNSWSPWRGCTKVSPGCAHCYAETLSKRNPAVLGQWGKGKPRVKAKNWNEPVKWNRSAQSEWDLVSFKSPTVFPSLCDWLDDEVPIEWLAEFLQLVHETPNLTWLLLTKRPENWVSQIESAVVWLANRQMESDWIPEVLVWLQSWRDEGVPPTNVWVGTSVEDQQRADERIPELLKIPARGRFLSLEPLLGPVDVHRWLRPRWSETLTERNTRPLESECLDWLIIGGESGGGSRPCNVEWIRSLVAQGKVGGAATFVKQLGAMPVGPTPEVRGRVGWVDAEWKLNHPKGGDPAEWPEDLRVRQFPQFAPRS
jgi:hypothetical protein